MSSQIYGTGTDREGFGYYLLPEWNVSYVTTTSVPYAAGVKNSIGVAVGVRSQDATQNLNFRESYDSGGGYLDVHIPIAVVGASYTDTGTTMVAWDTECTYEQLTNVNLPNVYEYIETPDNFGINATGTLNDAGTPPIQQAQNDLMGDAFWTGVEALLGGIPVGTWYNMYQTYVSAANAYYNPNIETFNLGSSAPGAYVIQSYDDIHGVPQPITGQSTTYNVFGASMYVDLHINETDFRTSPAEFAVDGYDWVNTQGSGCTSSQVPGANIPIDFYAYPAIEVEGTIRAAGTVVPNAALSLSDGSNVYTFNANGQGNYQGNYRFFAKPGTTYTLTATYGTAFGTQQGQTTFTTGNDPTAPAQIEDVTIPLAYIRGYVTCGYAGGCPSTPTDVVTNKATYVQAQTTGWSFFFWIGAPGTYEVFSCVGYYGSTTQPTVTVEMGHMYWENLTLDYYPPPPGCVLAGTLISTPNGPQKRVEQFSEGDAVLGYNVTTGSWVKESVTSNTATTVGEILSINNGLLETTLTDQPLFVRNGTWVGWVLDPQNLTVGEQLFSALTQSWVNITSLQVLQGTFKVYDLQTTAPNNFVANGVLVDRKTQ